MKSKLFAEKPATTQIGTERWVRLIPDNSGNYALYDPIKEAYIGRMLFDANENWIYDGYILSVDEQEDLAGFITGNHKEMNELVRNL